MNDYLSILGFILIAASSIFEAAMDTLLFHYDKSIFNQDTYNQKFYNPTISWINKWENVELRKEKFLGSSTIFVFTTDAWHLFKFFRNTLLFIGLPIITIGQINLILAIIIARIIYGIFFTIFFDKIFIKS